MTDADVVAEPGTAIEPAAPAEVVAPDHVLPGVPGRDEFLALAMQARMLSLSGAAPPAVRDNPHVAFHVAMVGRDLGISPSAALELIDVIDGQKGPQLSLSPQLMNGQIRRLGLGEIVKGESTTTSCTAIAVGPGGRDRRCRLRWPEHGWWGHPEPAECECDILGVGTFTWEDARMAGLVGPNCQPGAHVKDQNRRGRGGDTYKVCGCNQGYITYPQRMLWWRVSGYVADDVFPEAGLGLYSPEELGAVVDDEGRPIDVAHVELPPGYERAQVGSGSGTEAAPDEGERFDLQFEIYALPPEQLEELGAPDGQWKRAQLPSLWKCTRGQLRSARGLVRAAAVNARRANREWDHAEAVAALRRQTLATLATVLCGGYGPLGDGLPDKPEFDVDPDADPAPEPEAPQASVAPEPEPAPPQAAPPERVSPGDVAALRATIEAEVEGLSVAEVQQELLNMRPPVPMPSGSQAQRTALVNAELQRQLMAAGAAQPDAPMPEPEGDTHA